MTTLDSNTHASAYAANPYLSDATRPVTEEVTAFDLPVLGTIPADLEGRWLRNGPNPIEAVDPTRHHWFLGDGMVHGLRLRGGKAEWYRNRYVRADHVAGVLGEEPPGGPAFGGRTAHGPNTNVGTFAGKTWAMVEAGGTPTELSYELDTIARNDFEGTLQGPFSAHPKFDPATGEMHAMCYAWPDLFTDRGLLLHYVVVGSDGRVSRTVEVPVDGMPMVHDMSLTPNWALVYDLPVGVDLDVAAKGYPFPFAWNNDYPARVGLLPRTGANAYDPSAIVWCDVEPCYVFHPLNAYEDHAGRIVVDLCRYKRMMATDRLGPFGDAMPTLDRWTIDPARRTVAEERIDDRAHEFPRHDPRVGTREHRFGYTAGVVSLGTEAAPRFDHTGLYKTDYTTGTVSIHDVGGDKGGAEPVFVPKADSTAEDDGWILSMVHDRATDTSELHIIDAANFDEPAVAVITMPQRVPLGFHGNWCPDSSSPPPAG
ncbi:MAG: carotenoid oxygenase family protein [Acidimicrobiales bacterium]